MRTGHPTQGHAANGLGPSRVKVLTLLALTALAPVAASSAAASDEPPTATFQRAAVIELVPIAPTTEVTAPPAAAIEPAPSAPRETVLARGSASYYAAKFDGRRTASGERFDNDDMTAAHRTLPFGTRVRVTSLATGRSVIVRINDRGPYYAGRMIDLSRAAAAKLGLVARGHGTVEISVLGEDAPDQGLAE